MSSVIDYEDHWRAGLDLYLNGRHEGAAFAWDKAYRISQDIKDNQRQCRSAFSVGSMLSRSGKFTEALPYYLQSLHTFDSACEFIAQRLFREFIHAVIENQPLQAIFVAMKDLEELFGDRTWFQAENAFAHAKLLYARGMVDEAYQRIIPHLRHIETSCCSPQGLLHFVFLLLYYSRKYDAARQCVVNMRKQHKGDKCERCNLYIKAYELMLERTIVPEKGDDVFTRAQALFIEQGCFDTRFDIVHEAALRAMIATGAVDEADSTFRSLKTQRRVARGARQNMFELDLACARLARAVGLVPVDIERAPAIQSSPKFPAEDVSPICMRVFEKYREAAKICWEEDLRLETTHYSGWLAVRKRFLARIIPAPSRSGYEREAYALD